MKIINKTVYIILICFSINLYSQVREKNTIELTPKIGYSTFRYYASGFPSGKLNSINFGVTGDYYFNQIWSMQTGILYQKMGGKTFYDKFEIEYINLPINANWHFGSKRKWNFNIGMTTSLRLNDSESQSILGAKIKNIQSGFNIGTGYKIEISNRIGILIDYQFFSGATGLDQDEIYVLTNKGSNLNLGAVIKL